jgi:hypothetical protein
MATYIVFTRENTRNAAELEIYMQEVGATLAGHPITVLAAYGRHEVLEGPDVEGGDLGVSFLRRGEGVVRQPRLSRGPRASLPRRRLSRRHRRGRMSRRLWSFDEMPRASVDVGRVSA